MLCAYTTINQRARISFEKARLIDFLAKEKEGNAGHSNKKMKILENAK